MNRDYDSSGAAAPPDWRGLCAELLSRLKESDDYILKEEGTIALAARARAALSQPEPKVTGPTDEELLGVAVQAVEPYDKIGLGEYEAENNCCIEVYGSELIAFARAVLARWGRPAPVPAEGEVAELVEWLKLTAEGKPRLSDEGYARLTRAADLLERQAASVPVPVAERLPGSEDCDAEGRCWVHQPHEACPESPAWELMLAKYASANYEAVCWLPATALPLPQGEVQP